MTASKLIVEGGAALRGEVAVSGAKNAALPIICAALLTDAPLELAHLPPLDDIDTMLTLMLRMGMRIERDLGRQSACLIADQITAPEAPYELVKTMRAAILVLGPLLARFGEARVSLPGGCAIGERPVDQHISGLRALGAELSIEHGYIVARASKLRGTVLRTDMVTVTGTENLLMAATLAEGETVIENAACEPEVVDLAQALIAMGAKIHGQGTSRIVIEGVERLHGARHRILSDRIEAGTFLCAVAAAKGDIVLNDIDPSILGATLALLRRAGLEITEGSDWVRARMQSRPRPVSFETQPYPGLPTDMQAQFMALNTVADGIAQIHETIFENRYMHVQELRRLGADILVQDHTAIVTGMPVLSGAHVMATDLRASACLVIAGLVGQGETHIHRIHHLDRGYARIEDKLAPLGANIRRVPDTVTAPPITSQLLQAEPVPAAYESAVSPVEARRAPEAAPHLGAPQASLPEARNL